MPINTENLFFYDKNSFQNPCSQSIPLLISKFLLTNQFDLYSFAFAFELLLNGIVS